MRQRAERRRLHAPEGRLPGTSAACAQWRVTPPPALCSQAGAGPPGALREAASAAGEGRGGTWCTIRGARLQPHAASSARTCASAKNHCRMSSEVRSVASAASSGLAAPLPSAAPASRNQSPPALAAACCRWPAVDSWSTCARRAIPSTCSSSSASARRGSANSTSPNSCASRLGGPGPSPARAARQRGNTQTSADARSWFCRQAACRARKAREPALTCDCGERQQLLARGPHPSVCRQASCGINALGQLVHNCNRGGGGGAGLWWDGRLAHSVLHAALAHAHSCQHLTTTPSPYRCCAQTRHRARAAAPARRRAAPRSRPARGCAWAEGALTDVPPG